MLRVGEGLDVEGNHNAGSHATTHKRTALTTDQGPLVCVMIADIRAVALKPFELALMLFQPKHVGGMPWKYNPLQAWTGS